MNFFRADLFTSVWDTLLMAKDVTDEDTIQQVVERLQEKFPNTPKSEIEQAARAELDELAGRPVRDYLAILVERAAKKRLKKSGAEKA
ncbi:three-helix bundle dimerization domain-containing protein [Herbiconiux liangxiaofengii]|uniref:three-helix bundle dimerization domain-containing protein n=1 Tax=Herbiconiux liangxiaofengii TaxID=3342795 RepID=UPI0035B6AF73